MAIIIDLGSGESAVLKADDELTNKEVKSMQRASRVAAGVVSSLEESGYKEDDPEAWKMIAKLPDEDYDSIDLFQRVCVIVRLKSWTLDRPIPATVDEVDELPMSIYTPLVEAAVKINFDDQLELTPEAAQDPKAVTEGSGN